MNFISLNNIAFLSQFGHWFGQCQRRVLLVHDTPAALASATPESLTTQAALTEIANAGKRPHPHSLPPMTPQNWLAKQPPYNTIVVYIERSTCQLVELLSIPRHKLPEVLNIPMYRDPAAKWQQATDRCLRRIEFDPATDWFEHVDALEQLEFLQSARLCISTEMASLDLLITTLYDEVCAELGIETASATASKTASEGENGIANANANAKANASNTPLCKSPTSLPPAALLSAVSNATDRTTPANNWQLLGSFLNQRQHTSAEMTELDKAFLPALKKLGVKHHEE